jgi:hypothetical protein
VLGGVKITNTLFIYYANFGIIQELAKYSGILIKRIAISSQIRNNTRIANSGIINSQNRINSLFQNYSRIGIVDEQDIELYELAG